MSRRPPRRRPSKIVFHRFEPDGYPHNGVESCRRCKLSEKLPNGEPRAAHVQPPTPPPRPVPPEVAEVQARMLGESSLWDAS